MNKGQKVTTDIPGMGGEWTVVRTWTGQSNLDGGNRHMVEIEQDGHTESVGVDDVRPAPDTDRVTMTVAFAVTVPKGTDIGDLCLDIGLDSLVVTNTDGKEVNATVTAYETTDVSAAPTESW